MPTSHKAVAESRAARENLNQGTLPQAKIGIFHPADPAGHIPSGIDSFIRDILRWAPDDLEYTLIGATSDPKLRPVGVEQRLDIGGRRIRFIPIVSADPAAQRSWIPLTVRYLLALRAYRLRGRLPPFDVLDFHRIEPLWLFARDSRPRNVTLHQDMIVIRHADSDIMWRYWPSLYESIEHRTFRRARRVFAVRQSAVKRYQKIYAELGNRFMFLPTWVDPEVFHPMQTVDLQVETRRRVRDKLGAPVGAVVLAFVGRFDRQKDPILLIRAFHRALKQDARLYLAAVGDGVLWGQVAALIKNLSIEGNVSLLGAKRPAEIAELLQGSDLFVLASAYEGMPFAVLEALATGLPVVSTDVGEIRLVVHDGVNGKVCRAGSEEALSNAIHEAVARLNEFRGTPCIDAIAEFHPRNVLGKVYDNHRQQIRERVIE